MIKRCPFFSYESLECISTDYPGNLIFYLCYTVKTVCYFKFFLHLANEQPHLYIVQSLVFLIQSIDACLKVKGAIANDKFDSLHL